MIGRPLIIGKDLNQLGNLGFQYAQNAAANQLLQQELAQRERQAQFNRYLAQRQFEELSAPQQEAARQYNQALDWSRYQFGNESATQKVQDEINKALVRTQVMNTLLGPGYGGGYGGRSGYGYGGGYGTGLGGLSAYGGPSLTGLSNIGGFQQANTEAQNAFATQQANLQNDRLDAILKEKGGWTGYWTDASKRAAIDEAIKGIPPTPGAKFDAIQRKYIPDTQPPGFGIPGGLGGAGGYGGFAFGAPAEDAITKAARIQILKELFPNADLSSLTAATAPTPAPAAGPVAGGGGGTEAATGIAPVWTYDKNGRLLRNGKPVGGTPTAPAEGVPGFIGPPRPPPPPAEGEPGFIGPTRPPPGQEPGSFSNAASAAGYGLAFPSTALPPLPSIPPGNAATAAGYGLAFPSTAAPIPPIPPGNAALAAGYGLASPSVTSSIVQPPGQSLFERFQTWPGLIGSPGPPSAASAAGYGLAFPDAVPPVIPDDRSLLQRFQQFPGLFGGPAPEMQGPPPPPPMAPTPAPIPTPPTWLLNPGSAAALNRALSGIGAGTNQLAAPAQGLQYRNLPYYWGR